MKNFFLLSCSIAMLCVSSASVFYIRETTVQEDLRKEKNEREEREEEARKEKKAALDDYYADEFEYWQDRLKNAKDTDAGIGLYFFEEIAKVEDQMAREGYDRIEIRDIKYRNRITKQGVKLCDD